MASMLNPHLVWWDLLHNSCVKLLNLIPSTIPNFTIFVGNWRDWNPQKKLCDGAHSPLVKTHTLLIQTPCFLVKSSYFGGKSAVSRSTNIINIRKIPANAQLTDPALHLPKKKLAHSITMFMVKSCCVSLLVPWFSHLFYSYHVTMATMVLPWPGHSPGAERHVSWPPRPPRSRSRSALWSNSHCQGPANTSPRRSIKTWGNHGDIMGYETY